MDEVQNTLCNENMNTSMRRVGRIHRERTGLSKKTAIWYHSMCDCERATNRRKQFGREGRLFFVLRNAFTEHCKASLDAFTGKVRAKHPAKGPSSKDTAAVARDDSTIPELE